MILRRTALSALLAAAAGPALAMSNFQHLDGGTLRRFQVCVQTALPAGGGPVDLRFRFHEVGGGVRDEVRNGVGPQTRICASHPFFVRVDFQAQRGGVTLCQRHAMRGPGVSLTLRQEPNRAPSCD